MNRRKTGLGGYTWLRVRVFRARPFSLTEVYQAQGLQDMALVAQT